jgi:hypothetical protein
MDRTSTLQVRNYVSPVALQEGASQEMANDSKSNWTSVVLNDIQSS